MIEGRIDAKNFTKRLQRMRQSIPNVSLLAMRDATMFVQRYIVQFKLSGQVLKRKTNRLAGSIDREEFTIGGGVVGRVGSNVKYAPILELGGVIKAKNVPYLRFKVNGHWVSVKEVTIPPHPYIMSSLNESVRRIGEILGVKFMSSLVTEANKVPGGAVSYNVPGGD